MKRNVAISKASKFLGRDYDVKSSGGADKIKKKSKENPDLDRARINQIIADFFQRGVNPKDLDLEKIDWSVSYNNIRNQVSDLLDKRGVDSFESTKRREQNAMRDYARKKQSEQLMTVAELRHQRRPEYNQYVDENKEAEKKFGRLTESAYEKWSRNPSKYDIEGVDGKQETGDQVPLPLRRKSSSRIEDMRMSNVEQDLSDGLGQGNVNSAKLMKKDLGVSSSDRLDFSDSRSESDVSKSLKGGTSERSSQKGLREQGFVSKKSEKTLDKFDGNYV